MKRVLGAFLVLTMAQTGWLEEMKEMPIEERHCKGESKMVSVFKRAQVRHPPRETMSSGRMYGLLEWYDKPARHYDDKYLKLTRKTFPYPALWFEDVEMKDCYWKEQRDAITPAVPSFQFYEVRQPRAFKQKTYKIRSYTSQQLEDTLAEAGITKMENYDSPENRGLAEVKRKKMEALPDESIFDRIGVDYT